MFARRMVSTIVLILGVAIFGFGRYQSCKVTQGEQKISQAEQNAQNQRRPLLGPVRKSVNAQAGQTAQKKIGNEKASVAQSQVTAQWLQGTGIALFLLGFGSLFLGFSGKRKSR